MRASEDALHVSFPTGPSHFSEFLDLERRCRNTHCLFSPVSVSANRSVELCRSPPLLCCPTLPCLSSFRLLYCANRVIARLPNLGVISPRELISDGAGAREIRLGSTPTRWFPSVRGLACLGRLQLGCERGIDKPRPRWSGGHMGVC